MSGGGSSTSTKPDKRLRGGFAQLGGGAEDLGRQIRYNPSFQARPTGDQIRIAGTQLGDLSKYGMSGGDLNALIRSGGFVGTTADEARAHDMARSIAGSGVDPRIAEASGLFRNNAGVDALKGINVGQDRTNSLSALNNLNIPGAQQQAQSALQGLSFDELQGLQGTAGYQQQLAAAQGKNLQGNPFLDQVLEANRRQQTRDYQTQIAPGLAAQFGGGFGLAGSASMNAQRRAAEEVSRGIGEQETGARFQDYNQQIQRQHEAGQFLGNLDLQRGSQLGQLGLGRAQSLGQLGLGFSQQNLDRAGQLGQLGLGFTNAGIDRGSQLGNLQNQQGQGLLAAGEAGRRQELANVNLLSQIGAFERGQQQDLYGRLNTMQNAGIDDRLSRFGQLSGILGAGSGFGQTTQGGGASRGANALGGAATGASLGGFAGPWGAAAGALVGGGIGYFA